MRPVFNLEPKCRVTVLTRKNGSEDLGLLPRLKGSSNLQMDPGSAEGTGAGVFGQSVGRRFSIFLGKHASLSD